MENDAQLIHRVLSGDDEAFTALVRKHQKSAHALAWRRVGDFHFAEEIVQDAFLRAYKGLPKLKDPNQFPGWLYVITNRLCNNWLQKNKSVIKSVEDISVVEMQRMSYEHYMSEGHEKEAKASRQKLVGQLLAKLPESERTVVTLYYLGEMTTKEISKFLGVSVHTITSRLQRGRKRLKQHEELLVQEVLGGVQLSNNFAENIAQKVADVKLTPPVNWKPFVPWMAFGAAVLMILLLTASNQYLLRFQKPYSFEAESERTIEIIDAPIVLNSDAKPAVRNQTGRAAVTDKTGGDGIQISESVLVSNAEDALVRPSISRWTQTTGPKGGPVFDIFATSKGVLFAFSSTRTYRLAANTTVWMPIAVDVPNEALRGPMAERTGVLYLISNDAVFTSTDDGETWNLFCPRPEGRPVGLVIMANEEQQTGVTIYLALQEKGVFRSTNAGEQWTRLDDGLMDKTVSTITAVGNTVFVGTDNGLYRLDTDIWERLLAGVSGSIYSLAISKDNLYVSTGPDFQTLQQVGSKQGKAALMMYSHNSSLSKVFRSADLGASWTDITPTRGSLPIRVITGISLVVTGKTILAQAGTQFRSRDGGQTWASLGLGRNSSIISTFPSVAVNENTFYKAGLSGVHRTTDGGESWHLFMDGIVGTEIQDLVSLNNRLYANAGGDIVQSSDGGESWRIVRVSTNRGNPELVKKEHAHFNFSDESRLTITNNILYVITSEKRSARIFRLSINGNVLIPVQGIPDFEVDVPLKKNDAETEQIRLSEEFKTNDNAHTFYHRKHKKIGAFVVSGETFYTEYQRKLFKWKPGDPKWQDTGLVDTSEQSEGHLEDGLRLAVSGEIAYVGKRDGRLFQSLDSGNSWKDITPNLPLRFTCFKEIVFAGATVYVATDAGVLASRTGMHWSVIKDDIIIDRFAVDGATVYGASDKGVYRLDIHSDWKQIIPNVPGKVHSLVVDRNRLYVATEERGMFHISLEKDNYLVNH